MRKLMRRDACQQRDAQTSAVTREEQHRKTVGRLVNTHQNPGKKCAEKTCADFVLIIGSVAVTIRRQQANAVTILLTSVTQKMSAR
jgi:hypothetical protein